MTDKSTEKRRKPKDSGQKGFESSLGRLETIVSEMDGGSLSLEEMIARFEEGQSLIKFCTGKLNEVERKIEKLVKKGEDVVAEPLEEGNEGGSQEDGGGIDAEDELF